MSDNWTLEREKESPRVFGRGAMMKHDIPLEDLNPPIMQADGTMKRDRLILSCVSEDESKEKIGRIRAFVQRHVEKIKRRGVTDENIPKFSVMFGDKKQSIVIWRTK